jgi:hypothetical protein
MFDLGSAWTQPGAKDWVLRLKRWPVASTWDCGQRPAEHVVTGWELLRLEHVVLFKLQIVVKDDEGAVVPRSLTL